MSASAEIYDAVIVGGGPAGLTAALYLARARYRVLVVEKDRIGGQITITHEVVNYPGVEKTSGEALTATMRRQAENFGAEFMAAEVTALQLDGTIKQLETTRGKLQAFAVLLATGANPRRLGFPGEDEFRGRGVAYCATCDGEFFTGKELLVIGGGYAAAEEALFLTRYASKITMLVRRDAFSCAKSIVDEVCAHPKIKVLFNHEIVRASGDARGITEAEMVNNVSGERSVYQAADGGSFGIFVFAGYVPNTALVKDMVQLDAQGCILTDANMQTSIPGVFAAGDVCVKPLRQVVTAVADGALAACAMEKVAARAHETTGLVPKVPHAKRSAPEQARASQVAAAENAGTFISADMVEQLNAVFARMQSKLILEVQTSGDDKGAELLAAMQELAALTDKLNVVSVASSVPELPCVRLLREDNSWSGLAFHGVPGGHEFTSFILGLYNAAGPGQSVDAADLAKAQAISKPLKLQVLVSLSCTMCPDLVTATQRLASLNDLICAEVYDVNLYPQLRERYQVMSVPCLVVNEEHVAFGRKNLSELLSYLSSLGLA